MTFFNSWALWQKMTFVLACAIVVTVCLAIAKLNHNKRQLRHYAARAILEASALRTTVERSTRRDVEAEAGKVPFGVRAIESGIEVEGVWISRSNSPASSRPSSVTSSRRYIPSTKSQASLLPPQSPGLAPDKSPFTFNTTVARPSPSTSEYFNDTQTSSTDALLSPEATSPRRSDISGHDRVRGKSLPRDLSFLDLAHSVHRPLLSPSVSYTSTRSQLSPQFSMQSAESWQAQLSPRLSVNTQQHLAQHSPRLSTIFDQANDEPPSPIESTSTNKHAAQESVETVSSTATIITSAEPASARTTPDTKRSYSTTDTRETELSHLEQHRLQQVASTGQLKPRRRLSYSDNHERLPHLRLPKIRIEDVSVDGDGEQDLGLVGMVSDNDAYSFVQGEDDVIDIAASSMSSPSTPKNKKRFSRAGMSRSTTEPFLTQSPFSKLFRTVTQQPLGSSAVVQQEAHPLRRVEGGLLRNEAPQVSGPPQGRSEEAPETVEITAMPPRQKKKLQKGKQKADASQTSLRQLFKGASKKQHGQAGSNS